jgi:hypothetical protein
MVGYHGFNKLKECNALKNRVLVLDFDWGSHLVTLEEKQYKPEKNGTIGIREIYRLAKCDLFDVAMYTHDIAILVDDEGLLKSGNFVFEIVTRNNMVPPLQLAGTLLFVGVDGENFVGLTDEQIHFIRNNMRVNQLFKTQ